MATGMSAKHSVTMETVLTDWECAQRDTSFKTSSPWSRKGDTGAYPDLGIVSVKLYHWWMDVFVCCQRSRIRRHISSVGRIRHHVWLWGVVHTISRDISSCCWHCCDKQSTLTKVKAGSTKNCTGDAESGNWIAVRPYSYRQLASIYIHKLANTCIVI